MDRILPVDRLISVPAVEKSPELYAKFDDATTPVVILPPSIVVVPSTPKSAAYKGVKELVPSPIVALPLVKVTKPVKPIPC